MKQEISVFLSGEGLIALELYLYKREEGKVCKRCGFIQGSYNKGFENYYCIHLRNRIQKKLKPITNKLLNHKVKEAIKLLKKEYSQLKSEDKQ